MWLVMNKFVQYSLSKLFHPGFVSSLVGVKALSSFPENLNCENLICENEKDSIEVDLINDNEEGNYGVPEGTALAVSINGKVVFKKGSQGYSEKSDVSGDLVGTIENVTSTFTALMIMKLIQNGDLDSCSLVEDILDNNVWSRHSVRNRSGRQKYKISVKQLLQQQSGIKEASADILENNDDPGGSLLESVRRIAGEKLEYVPGTDTTETPVNYAFQLLGLVYETITDEDFVESLRDELVKMGLYDTDLNHRDYLALNRKGAYFKNTNAVFINPNGETGRTPYIETSWWEASSGLLSTTSDLIKFGNIMAIATSEDQRESPDFPLDYHWANQMGLLGGYLTNSTFQNHFLTKHLQCYGWLGEECYHAKKRTDRLKLSKDRPYSTSLYASARTFESASAFHIMETNFHDERNYPQQHQKQLINNSQYPRYGSFIDQSNVLLYPLGETKEARKKDVIVSALISINMSNEPNEVLKQKMEEILEQYYLSDGSN